MMEFRDGLATARDGLKVISGRIVQRSMFAFQPFRDGWDRLGQVFTTSTLHARHKRDGKNASQCVPNRPDVVGLNPC